MAHEASAPDHPSHDVVDNVTQVAPIVLPVVGAAIMFLLAFIAITVA